MTDKGMLEMDERADLSKLVVSADGYSSIRRGGKRLFPQQTDAGQLLGIFYLTYGKSHSAQLFFSRAAPGTPVLVGWKPDTAE